MDAQNIILGLVSVVNLLIGAIVKTLWDAIKKLTADLRTLETDLPNRYVRRDDFNDYKSETLDALNRIDEKLDDLIRR